MRPLICTGGRPDPKRPLTKGCRTNVQGPCAGVGVRVPADRPLPPALPQERPQCRTAPSTRCCSSSQMGSSQTWRRPGGDRQRERGGDRVGNLGVHTPLPPLGRPVGHGFSSPGLGHLWDHSWFSRYKAWRANIRVWGWRVPADEGSNWQTLYPPLHHTGWSTPSRLLWLSRSPLGLLPQTPANLAR